MEARGERLGGVRLDSGDIATLSREVRQIFDDAGLPYVRIFVSGGLDEEQMDRWLEAGAPIDAFGVGTKMDVSADAPYLDMAYKLVRYGDRYVLKTSAGKETWPGEKQVYRFRDRDGQYAGDLVALRDEPAPQGGAPVLEPVMRAGRVVRPTPPLASLRQRCASTLAALPEGVRRLRGADGYPVRFSDRLVNLQRDLESQVRAGSSA